MRNRSSRLRVLLFGLIVVLLGTFGVSTSPAQAKISGTGVSAFVRGADGEVYQGVYTSNTWINWIARGKPPVGTLSDPSAVFFGPGSGINLFMFVRGQDNALWYKQYYNGGWVDWQSLGGVLTSGPDATSWGPDHVAVFVRGADGHIYQRTFLNGSWGGWTSISYPPPGTNSDPSAVNNGLSNSLHVYVRGNDGYIWYRGYANTGWSSWLQLNGLILKAGSAPDVTSWGSGRLDVFAQGQDNQLYQRTFAGAWGNWVPLGGVLTSSPGAASYAAGRIDVFVRGADNKAYQKTYINGTWYDWVGRNGVLASGPDAAVQ